MHVYVNGNELLDSLRDQSDALIVPGDKASSRDNLARWLSNYGKAQDCEVTLVFEHDADSRTRSPYEHHGRTTVVNLQPDEEARKAIAGPANRAAAGERTYVVTSDPELEEIISGSNARVYEPRRFMSKARKVMGKDAEGGMSEPDQKYTGVPEEEVEFWAQMFEDEDGGSSDGT